MTVTQIVFEQLLEMRAIRYGSRVKVLWGAASNRGCQYSLRDIGEIVNDTLDRLRVDFAEKDLYMALEAMNVAAWHKAARPGASTARATCLKHKARRLCEAVGVT